MKKKQHELTAHELDRLRAAFPRQFYVDNVRVGKDPYQFPACLWVTTTGIRRETIDSSIEEEVSEEEESVFIVRAAALLRDWPELLLDPRQAAIIDFLVNEETRP